MQKFLVIGMGPGAPEWTLPAAIEAAASAEVLLGSEKLINAHAGNECKKMLVPLSGSIEHFLDKLETHRQNYKCAVLVTGDPGYYSLLSAVRRRFKPADFIVIPGITAFQLACARLGLSWQNYRLTSAHGKSLESMLARLSPEDGAVILTDRNHNPHTIGKYLTDSNWSNRNGWICENIGKEEEDIEEIELFTIPENKEYRLCLMILQPASAE